MIDLYVNRSLRYKRDMADAGTTIDDGLIGINQLATELEVTPRAIRFYEDKGLIQPQRAGTTRVYTRREVARMRLILRGKRLGFSLKEIKEFLDLYGGGGHNRVQHERLLAAVRHRLADLAEQRAVLDQTMDELVDIEREVTAKLRG